MSILSLSDILSIVLAFHRIQEGFHQLQDSALNIQNFKEFGRKLMFEMLHLAGFLKNAVIQKRGISDKVKW